GTRDQKLLYTYNFKGGIALQAVVTNFNADADGVSTDDIIKMLLDGVKE
ncbi:MAG: hypothetical protein IH969_07295, partial [Candidatus Krumholzibacteriota bacterium]|nr:hypothetical protein [Candidatus Krumholzibacteriota bacterium]